MKGRHRNYLIFADEDLKSAKVLLKEGLYQENIGQLMNKICTHLCLKKYPKFPHIIFWRDLARLGEIRIERGNEKCNKQLGILCSSTLLISDHLCI